MNRFKIGWTRVRQGVAKVREYLNRQPKHYFKSLGQYNCYRKPTPEWQAYTDKVRQRFVKVFWRLHFNRFLFRQKNYVEDHNHSYDHVGIWMGLSKVNITLGMEEPLSFYTTLMTCSIYFFGWVLDIQLEDNQEPNERDVYSSYILLKKLPDGQRGYYERRVKTLGRYRSR